LLRIISKSSVAHARLKHPRLNKAMKPERPTSEMDFGTACHAALFGQPSLTIIPAQDFRSARARQAREAIRRARGAYVLQPDVPRVEAMIAKLKAELPKSELGDIFGAKGFNECVAVWRDSGITCRARADRWLPPGAMKQWPQGLIVDYKTTSQSAAPEDFSRTLFNIGSDFQSTFYPHGFNLAHNQSTSGAPLMRLPAFAFIVQETYEPFEWSVLMPLELTRLHVENKIVRAFAQWREALESNVFAGYPRRAAYFEPPAWEISREERQAINATILNAG
jgi:hypothetical protein